MHNPYLICLGSNVEVPDNIYTRVVQIMYCPLKLKLFQFERKVGFWTTLIYTV